MTKQEYFVIGSILLVAILGGWWIFSGSDLEPPIPVERIEVNQELYEKWAKAMNATIDVFAQKQRAFDAPSLQVFGAEIRKRPLLCREVAAKGRITGEQFASVTLEIGRAIQKLAQIEEQDRTFYEQEVDLAREGKAQAGSQDDITMPNRDVPDEVRSAMERMGNEEGLRVEVQLDAWNQAAVEVLEYNRDAIEESWKRLTGFMPHPPKSKNTATEEYEIPEDE